MGDDPFDGGNLFGALGGVFGDLARLSQQQGPLNWEAARHLTLSLLTGDGSEPNVDPVARMAYEELGRVAELHVGRATGLSSSWTGRPVRIEAVTRIQWAMRTLDDYRPLFETLAAGLAAPVPGSGTDAFDPADPLGFMAPLLQMVGPMMLGMTAGSMIGNLAGRSFGAYDLPVPRPPSDALPVVMANVDAFGQEWSLPTDDLRLWVCLHEVAHHAVLGVSHLRARLQGLLDEYLGGFQHDTGGLERRLGEIELGDPTGLAHLQELFGDPEVLLGAIRSDAQRALLPQIEALVCLVVGVVDHTMDEVGSKLVSRYDQVTEALRRRRVEASPADRFVERLLGMELDQARYDRGATFVAGVVERAGPEGLSRLWVSERELPTPAELDAPGLWLARIDLPEA